MLQKRPLLIGMAGLVALVLLVVLTRRSQPTPPVTVPLQSLELQVAITVGKQLGEVLRVHCYPGSKLGYRRGIYACAVTEPSRRCSVWVAAPTRRLPAVSAFPSRTCESLRS